MPSSQRRSAGEGSIFLAADGSWRGYITTPTGRRYARARTRAELVRRLDSLRDLPPKARPSLTTGAYLSTWVDTMRPKVRPRVADGYASIIDRHVIPAIGSVPLARLTSDQVEAMTADLVAVKGLSPQTARNVRNVVRRALSDAARSGKVARNVAADAAPPRIPHREPTTLSGAQVRRFLDATADLPDGPLYALAVYTGLRQGELLGLSWGNLDASRLTVSRALVRSSVGAPILGETKTARSRRTIHLPPAAVAALAKRRQRQDADQAAAGRDWQDVAGLIFTDHLGRPLRHDGVSARFRATADRLGLSVRFHDLRHSYASAALAAGVPMHVVSRSLGHSSIGTTVDVYGHLDDADRTAAAAAVARAFGDDAG